MNNKIKFFLFLIFSFDLFAGRDVVDSNGKRYFLFDDGTLMTYDAIYKSAVNHELINAKKVVVPDEKTNQLIIADCNKNLYPLNHEQPIDTDFKKTYQPYKENPYKAKIPVTNVFAESKYETNYPFLFCSAALSIYGYFIFKLYRAKQYINKAITWASFKKNVSIEALYEIPEDKFLHDLMEVIYRTFSENEDNPNYEDIEPLCLFVKATHKEIKRLESFINLYWYLKLPVISLIFPNLDDELILAQEKIEKLSYMLDLVTNKICAMNY